MKFWHKKSEGNRLAWRDIALSYESTAISAQQDCVSLMVIMERLLQSDTIYHAGQVIPDTCIYCNEFSDAPHKHFCPTILAKTIIDDWEARGWLKYRERELMRLKQQALDILAKEGELD